MRIITDQDKSRVLKNVLVPPAAFLRWPVSGIRSVVSTGATDTVMSSWHITGFRDIVTLRRITQCYQASHDGRVLITDDGCRESWIWPQETARDCNCSEASSWPLTVLDRQHHGTVQVWAGVLASCVMNSRIFPWFIYFLSPLFWNLNAGDKRGPNDPFVWAAERASRQASSGNERLHLHIINGIHTPRHQSSQDDQELSGAHSLISQGCRDLLVFADPDKCPWHWPGQRKCRPGSWCLMSPALARKVPPVSVSPPACSTLIVQWELTITDVCGQTGRCQPNNCMQHTSTWYKGRDWKKILFV